MSSYVTDGDEPAKALETKKIMNHLLEEFDWPILDSSDLAYKCGLLTSSHVSF